VLLRKGKRNVFSLDLYTVVESLLMTVFSSEFQPSKRLKLNIKRK